MNYIAAKRFRGKTFCGTVNIPCGTECELRGETIYLNEHPLCFCTSENAHQFFARNDDGNGLVRGELIQEIMKLLRKRDSQPAWDRVWDDPKIRKYKRKEFADHWLWNHEFFNAEVDDLKYILNIVKGGSR